MAGNDQDDRITQSGWLTTGHKIRHYDTLIQAHPAALEMFAQVVRAQEYMTVQHDPRKRLPINWHIVEVREMDDGVPGVWAEWDTDRALWEEFGGAELLRAFSYTIIVDRMAPADIDPAKQSIEVSADAGAFDQSAVEEARAVLRSDFNVGGGKVLQFNVLPPPLIIVEFIGLPILTGAAGNALYAGLRRLLRGKRPDEPSRFTFSVKPGSDQRPPEIKAVLETSSEDALKQAIETFGQVATGVAAHLEFDAAAGHWISTDTPPAIAAPPDRTGPEDS